MSEEIEPTKPGTPHDPYSVPVTEPTVPVTEPTYYGGPVTEPTYYGDNPYTLTPPPPPRMKRRWKWPLIISLLLFAVILVAGGGGYLLSRSVGSQGVSVHARTTPVVAAKKNTSSSPIATATAAQPTATPTMAVSPTPTLTADQQAQALVQRLYDDINKKDFRDAYNLWGNDYHQGNTYQKFVNGYNDTMSDNVVLGKTQDNPDGSTTINVTLYATHKDSTVSIFTGPYTVGMENGTLKILYANLAYA